jgi:hypothetical protein
MPRPQFTLRTLLVAMLVVGAFLGGMALQSRLDAPVMTTGQIIDPSERTQIQSIQLRDETRWYRSVKEPTE